jgi:hypothetical protein
LNKLNDPKLSISDIRRLLRRLHEQAGHPTDAALKAWLVAGETEERALNEVSAIGEHACEYCRTLRMGPTSRPVLAIKELELVADVMDIISMDLATVDFHDGTRAKYVVFTDYVSRYILGLPAASETLEAYTDLLDLWCSFFGSPAVLRLDPFSSQL